MDATASEIRRYLTDQHDRFGLSTIVMAFAVLAVALAFGYIQRCLPTEALFHAAVKDQRSLVPVRALL